MDLNEAVGKALEAARRGDLAALEGQLVQLRALPDASVNGIGARFRALAQAVRSHPSFSEMPKAQAV
jgi:hypothetical protein